jgi:hypothetical protein
VIAVTVRDVSAPEALALPHYHGEMYIFAALAMGGVWMFSSAPLIILFGVVYVSDTESVAWMKWCDSGLSAMPMHFWPLPRIRQVSPLQ